MQQLYTSYDDLAFVYNEYWGNLFAKRVFPILEKLVLNSLPENASILDLCCGTGQLLALLIDKNLKITGLDSSKEMLKFAKLNAPQANIILENADSFNISDCFNAVFSIFDSLNHIMELKQLKETFNKVYNSLKTNGIFLFDLNMEEGFKKRWSGSYNIIENDVVCVVRTGYNDETKIGINDFTIFRLQDSWKRSDLSLEEKCYSEDVVTDVLKEAGFTNIKIFDALKDFNMPGGIGRTFFMCFKE